MLNCFLGRVWVSARRQQGAGARWLPILTSRYLCPLWLPEQVAADLAACGNTHVRRRPTRTAIGVSAEPSFLEARGKFFYMAFPAPRGHPHSLACGPFLHLQGRQRVLPGRSSIVTRLHRFSNFKGRVIHLGHDPGE